MSKRFATLTTVDPRTQLPLVGVPPILSSFRDLNDCVIHWISPVKSIDSADKETDLIAVLGDAAIYVCDLNSNILRCLLIKEFSEILVRVVGSSSSSSNNNNTSAKELFVGFKLVEGVQEFDLLLKLATQEDVQILVGFTRRIYWVHMGQELPVYTVGPLEKINALLNLTRPHRWTLRMEPIRKRKFLDKLIYDWQQGEAKDQQAIEEEFVRVKKELQAAVQSIRDREYNSVIQHNVKLLEEVDLSRLRCKEMKRLLERFVPDVDEVVEQAVIAAKEQERRQAGASDSGDLAHASPSAGRHVSQTAESFATNGVAQIFRQPNLVQGTRPCERCKKLKQLLDEHPNVDKVRCALAEDSLAEVKLAERHLKDQVQPLRQEVLLARALLSHTLTTLSDESVATSERIQRVVEFVAPFARLQQPVELEAGEQLVSSSSTQKLEKRSSKMSAKSSGSIASPSASFMSPQGVAKFLQSSEYLTFREEISALRTLLREVSNIHTAEIMDIRRELQEYDAYMLETLRDAIDHHQPLPGLSAVKAASAIFDMAKQGYGKTRVVSNSSLAFLDNNASQSEVKPDAASFSPLKSIRWVRQ